MIPHVQFQADKHTSFSPLPLPPLSPFNSNSSHNFNQLYVHGLNLPLHTILKSSHFYNSNFYNSNLKITTSSLYCFCIIYFLLCIKENIWIFLLLLLFILLIILFPSCKHIIRKHKIFSFFPPLDSILQDRQIDRQIDKIYHNQSVDRHTD